tara:strand:- start:5 stop:427 length:423 start_codon:yes stop_codon:yes gene_type:complete
MKKLIIFLIFFSFSAHSADNYKCIYETSVISDVVKKKDYMVGKEKEVKIDFKEKKLLDYPYKSISLQTKRSKDKVYGVIWGYEEVTWRVDVQFSDKVRRILFSLRYNELGNWASLSETMKLEDNVYSGHYFECEKSLFRY